MSILPIIVLAGLSGCAFVEYEHLSDPRDPDDGWDLVCVGVVGEVATVEVSVAPCKNLSPAGGEFIKVNARKVFD